MMSMMMTKFKTPTGKQAPRAVTGVPFLPSFTTRQDDSDSEDEEVPARVLVARKPYEMDKFMQNRRKANLKVSDNQGYGLDYSPGMPPAADSEEELMARTERTIARNRAEGTPEESKARFRAELDAIGSTTSEEEFTTDDDDEASLELLGVLEAAAGGPRGACEASFLLKNQSQPDLIAMTQGLVADVSDAMFPMNYYVFDLEEDELLKTFPQRALVLPKVSHLKDEVGRRAGILGIKPLRKSAKKADLINWLKLHPVTDKIDVEWLHYEANKTYSLIKQQGLEVEAAERDGLVNRNWTSPEPFLRLYHCACDDSVIVLAKEKDNCMDRQVLDARNSSERPTEYYEEVANLFNSKRVYVSYSLPDVHESFATCKLLKFEDMPGGAITAADVKARLGDARARMIAIISDWEKSGNGFGQRDEYDEAFGHVEPEMANANGDDRARFVKLHLGQRFHHLYLWHLADTMGVLKNVLNVLSKEVAGDTDSIPSGCVETQRKRNARFVVDDEERLEENAKKQRFREGVMNSLKSIGDELKEANVVQREGHFAQMKVNLDASILAMRAAVRTEEDKIEKWTLLKLDLDPVARANAIHEYQVMIDHHGGIVALYEDEIVELIESRRGARVVIA